MIEREQAEHNSQNIYYRSTIGAVEAGSILQLGLRLKTREDIRQVLLRLWQESCLGRGFAAVIRWLSARLIRA